MSDASNGFDLNWRVEETCRKAWPSLTEEVLGDWVLRFAAGHSRRANSANPLRAVTGEIGALIDAAEARYAAEDLPAIFRIPTLLAPEIETQFSARGYLPEGETITLYGDLYPMPMRRDPDVAIDAHPTDIWLTAMSDLQGHNQTRRQSYRAILAQLQVPAAFLMFRIDGAPAAMAYGALHDGLLCLESVITAKVLRGQGYASRVLGALMGWAIEQGATGVCLQVEAQNTVAQKLYRGMGLTRELYRYRYWRGAEA
nr:GNAT family N-acetyltransferase [uncultured Dongia sp.]